MTKEEAIIYFKQCNDRIISTCKDANVYDYDKQEIMADCVRKTYEANKLALEALEQKPRSEWQHDHEILKAHSDGANEVLDKIRAEILQLDYDLESVDYDHNDMAMTEEVHMICQEEVLQIIDKYKTESEGV